MSSGSIFSRMGQWFSRKKLPATLPPADSGQTQIRDQLGRVVRVTLMAFAVLSIAYVLSSLFLARSFTTQTQQMEFAVTVAEFQNQFQQSRIHGLLFIERKSLDDAEKFKNSMDNANSILQTALENPSLTEEDAEILNEIEKELISYRAHLLNSVESTVKAGVTENQGLQGAMRRAALEIEEIVSKLGAKDLEAALMQSRRYEKNFLLRGQEQDVNNFNKQMQETNRLVAKLDPNLQQRLTALLADYNKNFQDLVTTIRAGNREIVAGRAAGVAIYQPIPGLVERSQERRNAAVRTTIITMVATAAALILSLLGLGLLLRNVSRSANATLQERLIAQRKAEAENETLNNSVISILQAVNQLSQRDLTVKAPVSQDIIGTVSDSINLLTDETAKVLHGVTGIAGQVEEVSNKVKSQAEQVSKTAEEERKSVNQMVESLFEATQTMNQVAALAEQSNLSAEQATEVTDNALKTVTGTVKGMESIRETIAETEKRIKRLGERSQEISGIVNLINTISERTHVLALNASMQAAVAGEAGRGFAVVAEEVQRLAESSRNATQQIATLVGNIQIETNETINTVNRTIGQVVQGSEQAQKAGEQMRHTQEITAQLVSQVRRIAQSSEQQKNMSAQLLEAVQRIGQSTENTAQQIDAQNQGTDMLLLAAHRLVESVSVFKLPQAA